MKATCKNNCEKKLFVTTAHVVEEWVVDAKGNWVETVETLETAHGPDAGNTWTCYECGEVTEVTP